MPGEAPSSVSSFANAPGMVTITWNHSGDNVFWFVIELESPGAFWLADRDKRVWSITGLQPSHTYRFRVCAVHEFDRSCSGLTTVTTFARPDEPSTEPPPPQASPPLPAFVGSFEPLGRPGMLARHRNSLGEISGIASDLDRADATFRIHPADGSGNLVRLEASNFPSHFLRHQNFKIHAAQRRWVWSFPAGFNLQGFAARAFRMDTTGVCELPRPFYPSSEFRDVDSAGRWLRPVQGRIRHGDAYRRPFATLRQAPCRYSPTISLVGS